MGLREDVLTQMTTYIDSEGLMKLSFVLDMVINDYDINKKSRELTIPDNKNYIIIKNFLGDKILQGRSKATIEQYQNALNCMLQNIDKPIPEITTNDIRYHLAKWETERKVSLVTINNMRSIYSSFFNWCDEEGLINDNPMKKIKSIKVPKKKIKPLSDLEIEKIKSVCKTSRDRALVEFLYSTGMRVSECVALNIDDIDFQDGKAIIKNGKGAKERVSYISSTTLFWLEKYLNERQDLDECLWIGKKGRLTRAGIERIIKTLGKEAIIFLFEILHFFLQPSHS